VSSSLNFSLEPADSVRLINLCGTSDENLRLMEKGLEIAINNHGNKFSLVGDDENIRHAKKIIKSLYVDSVNSAITPDLVHMSMQEELNGGGGVNTGEDSQKDLPDISIRTRQKVIKPRGRNQHEYLHATTQNDIVFGIGPAGTGKTYLAVACAVEALNTQRVQRLVLVRPAVEAGEKLGFLPGDMADKIDPYLRPLYDALYEMLGFEKVAKLIERNVIEVAPLAFMRGRTLNEAFVILDEAQNTTNEQMKMFLTRMGFNGKAMITGDITQIDLPSNIQSGLKHAMEVLHNVKGVYFSHFKPGDVVRHQLVQRIVRAYEDFYS